MPLYQVELFRTIEDTAIVELHANSEQNAISNAYQMTNDLDWENQDENYTAYATQVYSSQASSYTSMADLYAQRSAETQSRNGYTPLVR